MPSTSPSHCSARWATSAISARPTKPSSRRTRAARRSPSSLAPSSTATRTRGTPVYGTDPFRLTAALRGAPTASRASDGRGIELGPERGVFSNDFLIPLAFDRRFRDRSDLADRFGVLQVRVDRRDDHAGFHRDEVDTDQRDTDPCVDDDPFIEYPIEDVNKTCAACGSFNGHQTLLESCVVLAFCALLTCRRGHRSPARERRQLPLERAHLLAQLFVFRR